MKHPGPAESVSPPPAATALFGDRLDRAEAYYSLLAGDGVEHGLIGPREVPRLWERHILNCAVIGELIEPGAAVVDIGSGAGLPGIPVAIARPDLRVTLVEPLLRRSEFLRRAVEELGIDVRVVRGRAEEKVVREAVGGADVVTSRAVAPLERLAKWSAPLIDAGGRLVAIKGSTAVDEIDRDRVAVERSGIGQLHVEECGGAVLDTPTTVIVGTKRAGAGASRARRERRSRRAKEKG
ncbi:16S rRNA (guanine(527)-N(7))-methyltransferase RsmG [Gordonia rhizosphera]|uniref:Ribosomal RNA small subunit methyltransferase G n=1 Tax=Gordonia rhizosphera NBRC 16068 TaxID=1108045 RepID=K6WKV2_9ACTN|nr:16S rRNA (guanine(527)-N(7))-methyltransferase RsmG [Gordonia rhizosphera]GAB92767.1 ribosomal RNA small subunit methyltransferase G [Gordonia rhizosphera NBRC 16068]